MQSDIFVDTLLYIIEVGQKNNDAVVRMSTMKL